MDKCVSKTCLFFLSGWASASFKEPPGRSRKTRILSSPNKALGETILVRGSRLKKNAKEQDRSTFLATWAGFPDRFSLAEWAGQTKLNFLFATKPVFPRSR